MTVRIITGDCRSVLKTLPADSVHCCVTSPPYWGLRSYLPPDHPDKHKEIGSEPTLQEWVQTIVEVFREVRRVLRPDGTLWLNLGDSYATGTSAPSQENKGVNHGALANSEHLGRRRADVPELRAKNLIGQPWRVAFALQADGWWLRQEIIWHKPNPMPESTRDRCTKAHEHVFLLSKSERYFYAFDAMQEPASPGTHARMAQNIAGQKGSMRANGGEQAVGGPDPRAFKAGGRRNNGAGFGHGFDANPKPRVVAAVSRREGPPGNPPEHTTQAPKETGNAMDSAYADGKGARMGRGAGWRERKLAEACSGTKNNASFDEAMAVMPETRNPRSVWTIPTHAFKGAHFATFPPALAERCITAGCPDGGVVLDPFGGSGTVGLVADRQHKDAILIDLDERNTPMAEDRIYGDSSLFANITKETL